MLRRDFLGLIASATAVLRLLGQEVLEVVVPGRRVSGVPAACGRRGGQRGHAQAFKVPRGMSPRGFSYRHGFVMTKEGGGCAFGQAALATGQRSNIRTPPPVQRGFSG